jgi:hypothetical protein
MRPALRPGILWWAGLTGPVPKSRARGRATGRSSDMLSCRGPARRPASGSTRYSPAPRLWWGHAPSSARSPSSSGEFRLPRDSLFWCSSEAAVKSRPEPTAREASDLAVNVTKLALSVAHRFGRGSLGLAQSRHLERRFVFDADAASRECVAVAAVRVGLVLAQSRQRVRQLGSSLLQFRSFSSHGFLPDLHSVVRHVCGGDRRDESSGSCKLAFSSAWGCRVLCWDQAQPSSLCVSRKQTALNARPSHIEGPMLAWRIHH